MHWLQDPNQSNADVLNNVRSEDNRHFRNKKKKYLTAKIDENETKSTITNIRHLYRSINKFKRRYQSRTNVAKDEKGDLVADSHSILHRWRNLFSHLLKIRGVNDVRQTERHTAEPPMPEPSAFEFEMTI